MNDYMERLIQDFKNLDIELVHFDNGNTPESMQAYILVSGLTKNMLKDKGSTALDLGNYLYRRFGLSYEMTPEFHRKDEPKNSIAFYVAKRHFEHMSHVKEWILEHDTSKKRWESVLYDKQRLVIPNT